MKLAIFLIVVAALLGTLALIGFNTRNKHGSYSSHNKLFALVAVVCLILGLGIILNSASKSSSKTPSLTAKFTYKVHGLKVTFDASKSVGKIGKYAWDSGDGSTGTGKVWTHKFSAAAKYSVKLIVTETKSARTAEKNEVVNLVSESPSTSPSASPTASAPSTSASSGGGKSWNNGRKTITTMPPLAKLEDPGPGNCLPGPSILHYERTHRPGGHDFKPPYDQFELNTLAQVEVAWIAANTDKPCVSGLAQTFDVAPEALANYIRDNLRLREVGPGGLAVQNSFFEHDGHLVLWKIERLAPGELVWTTKHGRVDVMLFICGNRIQVVTVHVTHTTTPGTTSQTSSAPTTHHTTVHHTSAPSPQPRPTPTPKPTHHKNGTKTPRSTKAPGPNPSDQGTVGSNQCYDDQGNPVPPGTPGANC